MNFRNLILGILAAAHVILVDVRRAGCDETKNQRVPSATLDPQQTQHAVERGLAFLEKDVVKWRKARSTPAIDLADELKRIAGHLVRHQETDGSWAWSSAPRNDGYVTGQVLYVLRLTEVKNHRDEIQQATPAEQYQTLLKQFQRAASSGRVLSDEERLKFVGQAYRHRFKLALKMVELAEKYPKDPIAVDALSQAVWQVNTRPWPVTLVGKDEARARAFALLQRDHIRSDKLGTVCQRLSFGFCKEYETFLRAVLNESPHKRVQAQACLALARFLNNRQQKLDLVKQQPKRLQEFADLFGKEYIEELLRQDRTEAARRIEALFEQAVTKYGDVNIPGVGVVGERAKAVLFEMRHLVVGKEAPDIDGKDQDGVQFKLSDYRGKVVLLDFWSQY